MSASLTDSIRFVTPLSVLTAAGMAGSWQESMASICRPASRLMAGGSFEQRPPTRRSEVSLVRAEQSCGWKPEVGGK